MEIETLEQDKTTRLIGLMDNLATKWQKATMCEQFANLRTHAYVYLYNAFHHKDLYDLDRVYQSIQYCRWQKEIYLCLLNEQLIASQTELKVQKKIDVETVIKSLQELINQLKGVL